MKAATMEKIYLSVTVVCVALCGSMIFGMLFGEKKSVPSAGNTDVFPKSVVSGTEEGTKIAVTEDFIEEKMFEYLPESFPLREAKVDIGADSIIAFSGKIRRDELNEYLKSHNAEIKLRYSLALLVFPEEFDAEIAVKVSENAGFIEVRPCSVCLLGKNIPTEAIPEQVSAAISDAVNKIIRECGDGLIFSGFEDGAVIFHKL